MKIRHLLVKRFRGIRTLNWKVGGDFACLVGPGDATKSTVLDAIELALSPRWSLTFNDTDFYNGDTSEPLEIQVTVGDLPEDWKGEHKFGLVSRGWSQNDELHDEPQEGDEQVITIRLRISGDLEPEWTVFTEREQDGRRIGAKDRERIGCIRLGAIADRHLCWARGSALSRLTENAENINTTLAEAGRAARRAVAEAGLDSLDQGIEKVKQISQSFGVQPMSDYKPHLDTKYATVGIGGLALHDGEVPVRMAGMGTRRLLTLGLQHELAKTGSVILIDEVEHGLEPFRIRHLLRLLRDGGAGPGTGQVLMTSHSPVAVGELYAKELRIARSTDGATLLRRVAEDLQPVIIRSAEAILSRKILVCEGRTELGFCRGLDSWWTETSGNSFGFLGVGLADGIGSSAPETATALASLGYDVAILLDSDVDVNPTPEKMATQGIEVIQWQDSHCLEEQVAVDLSWDCVASIVGLAFGSAGKESVRATIASILEKNPGDLPDDPMGWNVLGEDAVRVAIGKAAKKKGWFKRVDLIEPVVVIITKHWADVEKKDLGVKILQLRTWAKTNG